jgi:hypothetical protein
LNFTKKGPLSAAPAAFLLKDQFFSEFAEKSKKAEKAQKPKKRGRTAALARGSNFISN